jgi:hypothetical protein
VLQPWAKLQAMLQAAGPVGCCYKVLTGRVVERGQVGVFRWIFVRS